MKRVFQRLLFTVAVAVAAIAGVWSMTEALEMKSEEVADRSGVPSINAGRLGPTETATFALG